MQGDTKIRSSIFLFLLLFAQNFDNSPLFIKNKLHKQIKLGKKPSIDTIVFGYVANTYSAFLIQNMFPVTEKYIENQYIKNKVEITVSNKLKNEIIYKANKVLNLYNHGMKNIIFPNIDDILKKLLNQ